MSAYNQDEYEANKAAANAILATAPANAVAAIIAELIEDRSEPMTDYCGSTVKRTVFIGWRTTARENFSQLRKAAATFPETAHLGPGKDTYIAHVVFASDVAPINCGNIYAGQFYDGQHERGTFQTESEAIAYTADKPLHDVDFETRDGLKAVSFKWKITRESVEHRENYSMGGGNYLKSNYRHSDGWRVSSAVVLGGWWSSCKLEDGIRGNVVPFRAPIAAVPVSLPDFGGLELQF